MIGFQPTYTDSQFQNFIQKPEQFFEQFVRIAGIRRRVTYNEKIFKEVSFLFF